MAGEVGIADKPEMRLEAGRGEGFTQASDTAGNAPGPGLLVRAFKAEQVKLHGKSPTVVYIVSYASAGQLPGVRAHTGLDTGYPLAKSTTTARASAQ
jgi:hypothetical protein